MLQIFPIALAQVKGGQLLRKFVKQNQASCLFFVSMKTNHKESIE